MKDPDEVRPPSGGPVFIVLRVEKSRDGISLAPLDDTPLNLSNGTGIGKSMNGPPSVCTPGSTHMVNSPIASNTD